MPEDLPPIYLSPNRQFITITGTNKNDQISIVQKKDNKLEVKINNELKTFKSDEIKGIMVYAKGGDDFIKFFNEDEKNTPVPTYNAIIDAGAGNDEIYGPGNNTGRMENLLMGKEGNDKIYGGNGFNHILGGEGDDLLIGGTGEDLIEGEEGADTIKGGGGIDELYGGTTWYDTEGDKIEE